MIALLPSIVMAWRQLLGDCPWCGARMLDYSDKYSYCPNGCDQ